MTAGAGPTFCWDLGLFSRARVPGSTRDGTFWSDPTGTSLTAMPQPFVWVSWVPGSFTYLSVGKWWHVLPSIWTICFSFQIQSNQNVCLRLGHSGHSCVGIFLCSSLQLDSQETPALRLIYTSASFTLQSHLWPIALPNHHAVCSPLMASLKLDYKTAPSGCRDTTPCWPRQYVGKLNDKLIEQLVK